MKPNRWIKGMGVVLLAAICVLVVRSTEYETGRPDEGVLEVRARVLSVADEEVIHSGASSIGYQELSVEVLSGPFEGHVLATTNTLLGQMDLDNLYRQGDTILLAIQQTDGQIRQSVPLDVYRSDWLLVLFAVFAVLLLLYAGVIGAKALMSFLASVYILWEYLLKGLLSGGDPLMLVSVTVILLSAVIVFSVAGFTVKGLGAFIGTVSGLFITLLVTAGFGSRIGLYGMTQPYVVNLVISGHYDLDVRSIFYAAIVLGASGAAMDIAMDIAASMDEIREKKPDIGTAELIRSGFTVGRHVIGTMSTTLLLAYSGGYLTLLMLFMVKRTSLARMFNLKIVSAEIMRTLVGSLGLVLVAPLTAVVVALIYRALDGWAAKRKETPGAA